MSWISWMNKFNSLSTNLPFLLSLSFNTDICTPWRRKWKAKKGPKWNTSCNSFLITQSVFTYHWCSVPIGWRQSAGLLYWCRKLVWELKLSESLCSCSFSASSLDRKLPLWLPKRDLSVHTPLSLTLPSLPLQWLCKPVGGSPERCQSWDCSQFPIA